MTMTAAPNQIVRILALGRTQPARSLAADPRARLVPASDDLTALGELGSMPSSGDQEPILVLMPERTALADNLGQTIASIRTLEPGAKFVAVAETPGRLGSVEGIDAWVRANESPDVILDLARPTPKPTPPPPTSSPTPSPVERDARPNPAPRPDAVTPTPAPVSARPTANEAAVLEALTRGSDLIAPAIDLIKRRVGAGSLRFIPAGDTSDAPSAPVGEFVAPVASGAHTLGWLIGPACAADALTAEASLLALWLLAQKQVAQLRHEAYTDPLTGAWNRRYFERFAESLIRDAAAGRRPVTILLFDIDDFKHYNDAYGHEAGDDILKETVRLLNSTVRADDRVCRIGGDEFAVIFHEPAGPRETTSNHPKSIFDIANRFCRLIRDCRFSHLGDESIGTLTISGGLATYPWDGSTLPDLVRHADRLILESKRQGKNVICYGSCPPHGSGTSL